MTDIEISQKLTGVDKKVNIDKIKGKEVEPMLKPIPRHPLPFSQRLKKKTKEGKYQKFI